MKIRNVVVHILLLSSVALAQAPAAVPHSQTTPGPGKGKFMFHRELGKWWQNPEIVKKLQLNDGQVSQLEQNFYEHRLKLIDYGAEMEKQDMKLQRLLDADVPNEGEVESQIDQVLDARGKLEREFTMMNMDLRKVLSLEQWRQLKSIRGDAGGFGDRIFFHKELPPGAGPVTMPLPPGGMPPDPPPPMPNNTF